MNNNKKEKEKKKKKGTIYYKSYTCSVIDVFQGNDSTRFSPI
jgi:hypothetical protein